MAELSQNYELSRVTASNTLLNASVGGSHRSSKYFLETISWYHKIQKCRQISSVFRVFLRNYNPKWLNILDSYRKLCKLQELWQNLIWTSSIKKVRENVWVMKNIKLWPIYGKKIKWEKNPISPHFYMNVSSDPMGL